MKTHRFKQVDVFTDVPYFGNPVAVVLDAEGLTDDDMQRFAQWTNLSETTFVLPATDAAADYQVRIFTPGGELPFAGHPTLGTCHAWLEAGGTPESADQVVQQCAVGLVRVRRESGKLAFAAPPCRMSTPAPTLLAKVAAALGLDAKQIVSARILDNGPVWLGLLLDTPQTLLAIAPDHALLKSLGQKVGAAAVITDTAGDKATAPTLEVRAFAAAIGIPEDPVTGSLNASLAQWLIEGGHVPQNYVAAQGQCLGRAGRVQITRDAAGQIWVGGHSVTCITGEATL